MKDNHNADVSHTDEFDKMYQEMVKQVEDKYKVKSEYSDNEPFDVPTMTTDFIKEHGLPCLDGYIFKDENGNVINATKIVLEKKKKEYPKTLGECRAILGIMSEYGAFNYKANLITTFMSLLICRNAYWKLYGEEMRLGKPWEPDWEDKIYYVYYERHRQYGIGIKKAYCHCGIRGNRILVFPTEEMLDAFYENFKKEIEQCKELL